MIASIIIATYNEEKYIEKCIRSLEEQTISIENYEIIVVDGNSKDNTKNIVQRLQKEYSNILLMNNEKRIQSCAFNKGINKARAENVFIIGAHAEYPKTFVENSVKSLISENVDCVGGKIIMKGRNKLGNLYGAVRNTPLGGGLSPYRYSSKKQLVETVAFGCYKKETLKKVGGYNEELVKNQDNDLNKRIVAQGGKILFDPNIYFYYYTRDNMKGIIKQMYNYGYWEAELIKQQKEQFSITTIVPSIFVIYTLIAIAMSIRGNFLMLLLEFIPYLLVYFYIAFKYLVPKKQNLILSLILYFIIHFSLGIGFIIGLF